MADFVGHPGRGPKAWSAPGKLVRKEGKFSGTFAPWGQEVP